MANNPWIASEATTTSPGLLARELRHAWDDFLGTGRFDQARGPIAESWHRSQAAGIDPLLSRAPTMLVDRREVLDRWRAHPLGAAAPVIRRWLGRVADRREHLIVVTDADGLLLWLDGDVRLRSASADSMNFVEGAVWSEGSAGTNAIGTALAADHPVQVHGAEHFSEVVHGWTCSAVPVHDPDSGRLLGVIDLTGFAANAHPASLAAVAAAARAVEADLRVRVQERDARLRVRYLDRLTSGRAKLALVSGSGRVIADHADGFVDADRLDIRPGGGMLVLPDGQPVVAEALDRADAYLVRPLRGQRGSGQGAGEVRRTDSDAVPTRRDGMIGYRRAELELSHLAEEQAALRRVAMLVASQATAEEIFDSVAEEVARLLRADRGTVCCYEPDGALTVMASWSARGERSRQDRAPVKLESDSVAALVQRSGRPARIDNARLGGLAVETAGGLRGVSPSTIGAPILAEGRIWGVIIANAMRLKPFEKDAESWLMDYAELVATAISNAVDRAELNASRARIVDAADQERRRIGRDLHDGAQQRLVSIALSLRATASNTTAGPEQLRGALETAADALIVSLDELREFARGIHPAILSQSGIGPAVRSLCRRSAVPVSLEISTSERFTERVEVTAYYVASEALTNAVRHSRASLVNVRVSCSSGTLDLSVRDDGLGGADPSEGSGLVGLRDRVEAIGGSLTVESPLGAGTEVAVSLPRMSPIDIERATPTPQTGVRRSNN